MSRRAAWRDRGSVTLLTSSLSIDDLAKMRLEFYVLGAYDRGGNLCPSHL